jgi:hypothetical protein
MTIPVRQIEIKENMIAIESGNGGYYKQAIYDKDHWLTLKVGEPPPSFATNVKQVTYKIISWHGEDGKIEYFGVPLDEEELFSQLLKISEDMVQRKIDLEVEVKTSHFNLAMKQAIETATETTIKYISALPWWRRLFKAF